ncbi:MAG: hypothetical protein ACOCW2_01760, partial [Chitinivibrionales bacterium]
MLGRILSIIGAITVILVVLMFAWGIVSRWYRARVPSTTIVELDLRHGVTEVRPTGAAARFMGTKQPTIREIVDAFERAGTDDRVKGVIARIGSAS